LFLALALSEVALRVIVASDVQGGPNSFTAFMTRVERAPGSDPIYRVSDDPELGYEFVPGSRRGHLRINAHGFRGPEIDETPSEDLVRIAVIGDSEAFAARLPEERTLAGAVQDLLNQNSTDVRYEALNFGVPGYNTAQELRVLRTRVLPFRPAFVVLYYVFNDPEMQSRTLLLGSTPLSRSYLYMFATWSTRIREGRLGELKREHPDLVDYYRALHDSEYFEATKALIREMGQELERWGIELIVVIAPELIGYVSFDAYPYEEIHAELRNLASERITVIDPLDDLIALDRSPHSLWVAEADPHKNALATRAIAARIARHIRAHPGTFP
jgi:hypothetical protein